LAPLKEKIIINNEKGKISEALNKPLPGCSWQNNIYHIQETSNNFSRKKISRIKGIFEIRTFKSRRKEPRTGISKKTRRFI
jgi:hypothetical protein